MTDVLLRTAKVLAFQRRTDIGDDERFEDDGTRDGYWKSLTDQARELMLLRAQSLLAVAFDPDDDELVTRVGFEIADEVSGDFSEVTARRMIASLRTMVEHDIQKAGSND